MLTHKIRSFALVSIAAIALSPTFSLGVNHWWAFPFFLLLFFGYAIALFAAGHSILSFFPQLEKNWATLFLSSSLYAVITAMIFGHLGLIGGTPAKILFLLFLAAPLLMPSRLFRTFPPLHWQEGKWALAILGFVFFLRFFSGFLPQAHGDPLLYHLMAPRLWNLQGVVALNHDLPIPLLAASWEYFYLWPQILLAGPGASVKDLVLAQIFSQWIHLFWGLLGSFFVLREIARKTLPSIDTKNRFYILLPFFFVASLQWTAPLAKNDCGMALWSLGAWYFLREKGKLSFFLGGLFAGFAVAAKINAILFLIPVAILLLGQLVFKIFQKKGNLAQEFISLALAALGSILGVLPIYFRNWWETGNPFYTMFAHIFPSYWISQSWAVHFSAHQPTQDFLLFFRLKQLMRESPTYYLWILLPFILIFSSRLRGMAKDFWQWPALFLLSFLVCIIATGTDAEIRYIGAGLWVGAIASSMVFLPFCAGFPKVYRWILPLYVIALLAASKLPTHFLWKFFKTPPGEGYVLQHTAGQAKKWVRENVPSDRLVVLNGENETYYLSTNRVTVLTENPETDRATFRVMDLKVFVRGLCESSQAEYLLDARESASLKNRFPSEVWDLALLFEADKARVYSLSKLEALVLGKTNFCGRK